MERNLPPNFVNPFYRTPRVREVLARSSWFGPGEKLVKFSNFFKYKLINFLLLKVRQRKAETIPRSQIYSVLTHAGFIPRRYF